MGATSWWPSQYSRLVRKAQRTCESVSVLDESDEERGHAHRAETLQRALCTVRAGLGVKTEGTESAEVLELWQAFVVESIQRILSRWCLDGCHVGCSNELVEHSKRGRGSVRENKVMNGRLSETE